MSRKAKGSELFPRVIQFCVSHETYFHLKALSNEVEKPLSVFLRENIAPLLRAQEARNGPSEAMQHD